MITPLFTKSVILVSMENDFAIFLNTELQRRGWSQRELGRRSDVSGAAISQVISGVNTPSAELCIKIATALDTRPEYVLRLAGHLPPLPPAVEEERELLTAVRTLGSEERRFVLRMLYGLNDTTSYRVRMPEQPSTAPATSTRGGTTISDQLPLIDAETYHQLEQVIEESPDDVDRLIDFFWTVSNDEVRKKMARLGVATLLARKSNETVVEPTRFPADIETGDARP